MRVRACVVRVKYFELNSGTLQTLYIECILCVVYFLREIWNQSLKLIANFTGVLTLLICLTRFVVRAEELRILLLIHYEF